MRKLVEMFLKTTALILNKKMDKKNITEVFLKSPLVFPLK